jgi:2'-5' RNA ligase
LKPSDRHNTIRTFIAIPLPKNISLFLGKIQGAIRKNRVKASWTKTSSMHLTLRFIGDTVTEDVKKIIRAMEATAVACAPFTLFAGGVGVFPGIKKARVIWSGAKGEIYHLRTLQMTLEKNLAQTGIKADNRRFSPHFTLGRFKNRVDTRILANIIQNFGQHASDPCRIKSMVLFKSDLMPGGAVHTPLFKVKFSGNPPRSNKSGRK